MFKLIGKKIIAILRLKNLLDWPYVFRLLHIFKCSPESFTMAAKRLSGRVLDSRPRGCGFEPHRRHCVVVLEQDTFILA